LDFLTSQVTINGPLTKADKSQWDRFHDLLGQVDREVESLTAQLKKARAKSYRASLELEIAELQHARGLLVEKIGEPSERRTKTAPASMDPSEREAECVKAESTATRAKISLSTLKGQFEQERHLREIQRRRK
jgi:hypothetical protein